MPELVELASLVRLVGGLLVLSLVVSVGFNLGMLSRIRELERRLGTTLSAMDGFLRGVRAVRRVRQVRKAQQEHGRRPHS